MKVYLNEINGIADAIVSMHMSKRTWSHELDMDIRNTVNRVTDRWGWMRNISDAEDYEKFHKWFTMLLKWAKKHITLGKFIDLSFTVEGLHRGGQDDWDSHAKRFDNRIIRASTRLADFSQNEKSAFYEDKILSTDEAADLLGITLPEKFSVGDGKIWVKSVNGYISQGMENNKDVKRGLYMLSIPSTFIFRINLIEFAHLYKERNNDSSAHPEVKECAEMCMAEIHNAIPLITSQWMTEVNN